MQKKRNRIGIMSGRLSLPIGKQIQAFPQYSWKEEFAKASNYGFELIEWIFDLYEKNPILDDIGIKEIKSLSQKYEIRVNSICADYFMEKMLFNVTNFELEQNLKVLKELIKKCYELEIEILEIPLVDSSSLKNKNTEEQLVINLQKILPICEENNVKLTLETDLPPHSFKELLSRFNTANIKANYDTGNSAASGYDLKEELTILSPWIANIHIKDRKLHGDTVPLGTGDTNFDMFFSTIRQINYNGDLIIQGAREFNDLGVKPEVTCRKYLLFVKQYVDKYLSYNKIEYQEKKK